MEKPSPILEKRMQELESDVNDVLSLPSDTPSHQRELLYKDFDQRITFLKNLLSAEITSSPNNPPLHLKRIQQRLSEIESAFTGTCASEPVLTCSCVESDDGCGGDQEEVVVNQENAEEKGQVAVIERVEKKGGFCGSFGVGFVVGMAVMGFVMVNFFECFSSTHRQYPVCLAPT